MQQQNKLSAWKSLVVIPLLFVTACSYFHTDKVDVTPVVQLNLPDPTPLTLDPVSFRVITDKTQKEVFHSLPEKFLIGLTAQQYQNLSINTQKLQNYVVEQKLILDSYRSYYEKTK